MTLTAFPNGVSSFGIPQLGALGIPFTGDYFFVDPANGLDGNTGRSPDKSLKTLSAAHSLCEAGKNDVVLLIGNGTTSGSARESATLAWSKDATHLIGIAAPGEVAGRARIAATSGQEFTPLVNVTADGCYFANLHAFHGYDDASAQMCWNDGGERNVYHTCHFGGMGHATAGDQAGGRSFRLNGSGLGEHLFMRCTFGLDTIARSAANATLEMTGGITRTKFVECLFPAYADAASPLFLTIGASGIDRFALFERCVFINSGTSTMTVGAVVNASAGGVVLFKDSTMLGVTDVEAAAGSVYVDGGAPTAASTALAVNVA